MHPPLKFSGIRRSITAIACTAAIVISAGCDDSSSPKLGNSSPNQTLQTASVEPTPEETAADQRARALLARMTLDEKVDMMHGESNNFYGFRNAPIPRLGIPALIMADGPMGVRIAHPDVNGQRATQLRFGLALAATWDTTLAEQCGKLMDEEAHSTGHNIMLGPVLDIARIAQFGRVFENYGEDPLLSGMVGAANIRGIQTSPVTTSVKHYNLNFQEINRLFGNNSIVDERTLQQHIRGYDPVSSTHAWGAPAGNIPIMVGASSADIRLNGTVQTAATTPAAPAAPASAATAAPATSAPLATTGRAALEVA